MPMLVALPVARGHTSVLFGASASAPTVLVEFAGHVAHNWGEHSSDGSSLDGACLYVGGHEDVVSGEAGQKAGEDAPGEELTVSEASRDLDELHDDVEDRRGRESQEAENTTSLTNMLPTIVPMKVGVPPMRPIRPGTGPTGIHRRRPSERRCRSPRWRCATRNR